MKKRHFSPRLWIQIGWTALTNGYVAGFAHGKIYQGPMKQICLPGLNCYSCPGALGSCPVGALQAVLTSRNYGFSFYVVGLLMAFGALFGRLICGFLCPFGLVQDLLHKIPLPRRLKIRRIPGEKKIAHLRYLILIVFVVLLPALVSNAVGQGDPWFCKYICPSGTLMGGVPLVVMGDGGMGDAAASESAEPAPSDQPLAPSLRSGFNPAPSLSGGLQQPSLKPSSPQVAGGSYREAAGPLFHWKLILLLLILAFSILYYRPFCRFLCPLGAIYGLVNSVSIYRYKLLEDRCVHCGACKRACKLGIDPVAHPNSPECIRCGDCVRACPHQALLPSLSIHREKKGSGGCKGNCQGCSGCGTKH